jgi:SSS family solute:Na+ symporter
MATTAAITGTTATIGRGSASPSASNVDAVDYNRGMTLSIHPIDLAIVVAYLVGTVLFGLWIGRGQRGISDYLLGERSVPAWLVLLSIVATETSSVTFLSVPGRAYNGNMTFLQLALGYVLGRYAVVGLLLPLYFRGEMFTAYEVLSQRFGGLTKQAASLLFIVTRSLADGLRLYLSALVLKVMLFREAADSDGFDDHLAIAVVIMGAAMMVYTFFGGMRAVVWTDATQVLVYVLGAVLAFAVILSKLPEGWQSLVDYGRSHGKFTVIDTSWDFTKAYTLWAGVLGGAFFSLGSHGADQLMVQRYLSARSQKDAGRALWLSGWVVLAQFALFLLLGVGLACFYQGREFKTGDEVFARFILDELPVGLVGFTLAAVFAAAFSGSLNSLAAAAVNDFYVPIARPQPDSKSLLWITRGFTLLFGLVQIGVGIWGQYWTQAVVDNVLAIAGFTTGIVLGIFFLGIFARRATQGCALFALVGGLAGMTWIKFQTDLAWPWFVLIGSLGTLTLGLLATALVPRTEASAQSPQ